MKIFKKKSKNVTRIKRRLLSVDRVQYLTTSDDSDDVGKRDTDANSRCNKLNKNRPIRNGSVQTDRRRCDA